MSMPVGGPIHLPPVVRCPICGADAHPTDWGIQQSHRFLAFPTDDFEYECTNHHLFGYSPSLGS